MERKTRSQIIQRLAEIARTCRPAARQHKTSPLRVFLRILRLYLQDGYTPRECFINGLDNPRVRIDKLKCMSKNKLMTMQSQLNPKSLVCLTEDKSVFYPYCAALGIPVPKLYAVIQTSVGWLSNGSVVASRHQWERFFREDLPDEFVIKPANGVYGRGVNIYRRCGDGFLNTFGVSHTASEILDLLSSDPHYHSFVVQERLRNHAELLRLSHTDLLHTVRFTTLVDRQKVTQILDVHLKIATGDKPTNNFDYGRAGNLLARVSLKTGSLKPALSVTADGLGALVFSHPKTGVAIEGFPLPLWNESCELVRETALKFFPLRTIGWDVALTAKGPVIVEGNTSWDPPNYPPYVQWTKSLFLEMTAGETLCSEEQ